MSTEASHDLSSVTYASNARAPLILPWRGSCSIGLAGEGPDQGIVLAGHQPVVVRHRFQPLPLPLLVQLLQHRRGEQLGQPRHPASVPTSDRGDPATRPLCGDRRQACLRGTLARTDCPLHVDVANAGDIGAGPWIGPIGRRRSSPTGSAHRRRSWSVGAPGPSFAGPLGLDQVHRPRGAVPDVGGHPLDHRPRAGRSGPLPANLLRGTHRRGRCRALPPRPRAASCHTARGPAGRARNPGRRGPRRARRAPRRRPASWSRFPGTAPAPAAGARQGEPAESG